MMSPHGMHILRTFQAAFAELKVHAETQPAEAAQLGQHIASHLHSSMPMVFLLDTGPVERVEPEPVVPVAPRFSPPKRK